MYERLFIHTVTMYSGKHPSPPEHAGKKKQRRTGPLSFHIGKITQGLADLRDLDDITTENVWEIR